MILNLVELVDLHSGIPKTAPVEISVIQCHADIQHRHTLAYTKGMQIHILQLYTHTHVATSSHHSPFVFITDNRVHTQADKSVTPLFVSVLFLFF